MVSQCLFLWVSFYDWLNMAKAKFLTIPSSCVEDLVNWLCMYVSVLFPPGCAATSQIVVTFDLSCSLPPGDGSWSLTAIYLWLCFPWGKLKGTAHPGIPGVEEIYHQKVGKIYTSRYLVPTNISLICDIFLNWHPLLGCCELRSISSWMQLEATSLKLVILFYPTFE